ncbi:phosphoglucosamine mutase [Ruminococcaceae bacterium FB2012]|nr:phosphoglucosamine mutase [Ruminococcaceae bacterium FB2012]
MGKLFGTDGVRGIAVSGLDCSTAMRLGKAAAAAAVAKKGGRAKILIGKDTRASGDILEAALTAGICSAGADVHILGVIPTQGVSYLTTLYEADAGIMITASSSPAEYNGIKLFSHTGFRYSEEKQDELERLVNDDNWQKLSVGGEKIGRIRYEEEAEWDYIRRVVKAASCDLRGIKVALDCANGAPARYAKRIFEGMGASCVVVGCSPDGFNINSGCGVNHLDLLRQTVTERHCDIGLAFDGDGSKCIAVDEKGGVMDGDKMLAIFSKFLKVQGKLQANTVVATVMSNYGLTQFGEREGINVTAAAVGSGTVIDRMLRFGYNLGGEQNGHIVFLDFAKTGDGMVTGVRLLEVLKRTRRTASELSSVMEHCPQITINVPMPDSKREVWAEDADFRELVTEYKKRLGHDGRIIVRESGTESVVRIMIEGKRTGVITEYAQNLAAKLTEVMNSKSEKQLRTEEMLREIKEETDNGLSVLPQLKK